MKEHENRINFQKHNEIVCVSERKEWDEDEQVEKMGMS